MLAEHGLNLTRSFCFWPDFMPTAGRLDEHVPDRFADFLDAHVEVGLHTVPTFIVGHMSGENWDPPWRGGRDLYRDVWLVSEQAWFAAEIAGRFGRHPCGRRLARLERDAALRRARPRPKRSPPGRASSSRRCAPAGRGSRSRSATAPGASRSPGSDNGYSLRALAPLVDFVGPHVYPMQDDQVRQLMRAAFVCELAGSFGKPVVLEEFGVTSDFASNEHAADYYRQVLYTSLLAGARGWIAWNNCDYDDIRDEDPYRHHVFELHFGLTDRRGQPKEQLHARGVLRARRSSSRRRMGARSRATPRSSCPSTSSASFRSRPRPIDGTCGDNLCQAYVAAREADFPVQLVRERDGIPATARLYIVPCAKLLTGPGIDRLRELAPSGATVYLSYFAGSTSEPARALARVARRDLRRSASAALRR